MSNNFGWIPHEQRSLEVKRQHIANLLEMPAFKLTGSFKAQQKVVLWDPVLKLRGKHLPTLYQEIGNCTGCGKSKAETYLQYAEVVVKGEREIPKLVYEPYGYAQGRVCAGISGNEDGGTGSGISAAARKYGLIAVDTKSVPAFKLTDTQITFDGKIDKAWGQKGAPTQFIQEGVQHLVKTTALIKTPEDAATALMNYYPVVICSDWGGKEQDVPVKGTKYPVLLNPHVANWPHCMCTNGYYDHPELGEIFHIDNSWGPEMHGKNPDGAPPGGFWVTKADMKYILSQGDSYAYSTFNGFPAQDLSKALFDLIGKD